MNVSPFIIQLAVVVVLVLAVAAWTLSFVLRGEEGGAGPIIKARAKKLQKGWYQLDMRIANRAPYRLTGLALRRVRPRAARLMAPITSVSTPKGDFQVWSDPSTDNRRTSISLHFEIGPHEERHGFAAQGVEAHATAWLFLPEGREISELALELAFVDRAKNLRRFRFGVALVPPQ
ncbi:MAG TPA: hypothetical protein VK451_07370 [Methyloceanibacter sp.]|nr:hypothetical protein [Methyloceanibacter sp.]